MNPTHGTASTQSAQSLTLDDIKKAKAEFQKFQANEWALMSPTGVVYMGSPAVVANSATTPPTFERLV